MKAFVNSIEQYNHVKEAFILLYERICNLSFLEKLNYNR